jgi:hypothetical protein
MTDAAPAVTKLLVDGVGMVELEGVGPWHVQEVNRNSFDIRDANGRVTNPAVTGPARGGRGVKRSAGLIYADKAIPNAIVAAFNAQLANA